MDRQIIQADIGYRAHRKYTNNNYANNNFEIQFNKMNKDFGETVKRF